MEEWAPVVSAVVVAVAGLVAALLNSRNDRAITNLEADLLQKLDPESQAATELSAIIEARVSRWHAKFYKIQVLKSGPPRLVRRSAGPSAPVLILVIVGGYLVLMIILSTLMSKV